MNYQQETQDALNRLGQTCSGTVAHHEMQQGTRYHEPLLIAIDCAIRYAKAHQSCYGNPIKDDYVLGPEFLSWITGIRGLLNGQGAVALEKGWTRDSKDNGTLESMFWSAMQIGGFTEADL